MPLTSRGNLRLETTNGRPLCPGCRAPMWGLRVQHEKIAYEKLTFHCPRCDHFPETRAPVSAFAGVAKSF
jgi:RNase P subunit RPR2